MAQAIITCGQCGQRLTIRDTVCPKCNTPVDFTVAEPTEGTVCKSCGQKNDPAADFCQSCGVRLKPLPPPKPKAVKPPKQAGKFQGGEKRRDYWPYIAIVAILGLAGVIAYTEWFAQPGPSSSSTATKEFPASQSPKVTADDIDRAQKAVDANPNDPSLRLRLANMQQDGGFFFPAIENYKKYLAKEGTNANARVDMGVCYYNLGLTDSVHAFDDYSTAVKEMRKAFEQVPSHQPAAFNLGIVFLQMGEMDSSNAWFKRALTINTQTELGKRAQKILEQHGSAQ